MTLAHLRSYDNPPTRLVPAPKPPIQTNTATLSAIDIGYSPTGHRVSYASSIHDILSLAAYKEDHNGTVTPSTNMLDARYDLHCFYDQWLSCHQELSTLLDNKNSTHIALFTAKHPYFDLYTEAIEGHTARCHDLLRSCNYTPAHYTTLHNHLWSAFMNITWINFAEGSHLPDTPTIYHNTDSLQIENHHATFATTKT